MLENQKLSFIISHHYKAGLSNEFTPPLQSKKAVERLQKAGMNTAQAEAVVKLFNEFQSSRVEASHHFEVINTDDTTSGHVRQSRLGWDKVFLSCVGVVVIAALLKYIFVG